MLVAIEGPDRVGKTSVWRLLMAEPEFVDARFVPNVSADGALLAAGDAVQLASEMRVNAWLQALHVPSVLYVCDRCPFVSNLVYAVVHGRDPAPRAAALSAWADQLFVVHLDASESLLVSRGATPVEVEAAAVYRAVLRGVRCVSIDAGQPLVEVVEAAKEVLRGVR